MAAFCAALLCINAFAAEDAAPRSWTVLGLRAPVITPERVKLRISNDCLTFLVKKQHILLEIPASQIVAVMYTPVSFNRGAAVLQGMPTTCVGDSRGCGGLVLLTLTMALFLSPTHGRTHYIRITWSEQNVEQQLEFEIGKNDYQPLLDALKDFSGIKYVDLELEGQSVLKELGQNAGHALPLRLDHDSHLGPYELVPGDYQLLALNRGENRADVYVFAPPNGQGPAPANLKAVARARLQPTQSADLVEFKNGSQIATIAVNGQKLNFIE
jgi:hypothetical protein